MNLLEFLNAVDDAAARGTQEQLASFVHETARTLSPDKREEYYHTLLSIVSGETTKVIPSACEERRAAEETLAAATAKAIGLFESIEEGEIALEAEYNEEYDDWYGVGEEFLYSDPEGIMGRLEAACALVHRCVDAEAWEPAADLGEALCGLSIPVNSDYDLEPLDLREAVEKLDGTMDLRAVLLDAMYAAYQTGQQVASRICWMMCGGPVAGMKLEDLMQHAKGDLKGFRDFLEEWISALTETRSLKRIPLYEEAIAMLPSVERQISCVREHEDLYPEGHLLLLGREDIPKRTRFEVGMEGVSRIGRQYRIRAEIALKTASLAISLGEKPDTLEALWMNAFESDTNGENCLRILVNARDRVAASGQMNEILRNLPPATDQGYGWKESEPEKNRPNRNVRLAVRFLLGDFEGVLRDGLSETINLGWSRTFMKQGIALFLSAFCPKDDQAVAVRGLLREAEAAVGFKVETYRRGMDPNSAIPDSELFPACFRMWKSSVKWPAGFQKLVLTHLEACMRGRVQAITGNSHTHYYGECARFVAAIGEVRESLGEAGAKKALLDSYRTAYRRYWRLRQELDAYA